MYKIKVRNNETGKIWWEYGFSKWMMKRLHFLFNDTDSDFYHNYDILEIVAIVFSFDTFKKCWTNHATMI